ncbi:MAG: N-acetylmuramoyl-L-alanine amidase [Fibrobacteria bacterium]|nr:N-acetylmuramoyl-L-alanine amidase [Fibrobacteria bacterium]
MLVKIFFFLFFLQSCYSPPGPALSSPVSTSPLNANSYVVAIDIGHTMNHPGVIGARGVPEFLFNQNLAMMLKKELDKQGFTQSFIINPKGNDIALKDRTKIARDNNADIFLSIHHDSVQPKYLSKWVVQGDTTLYSDEFQGYSLFYSEKSAMPKRSLQLAQNLGAVFRENGFTPTLHHAEPIKGENRELVDKQKGIYRFDDLVVLKTSSMPAVLIESGVLINRDEELLLSNPVYQRMLVLSMVKAVSNFCKGNESR